MTLEITAIVAPMRPENVLPRSVPPRELAAVDEFATAVGAAAGCEVRVIEGTVLDAPATGYLLAYHPLYPVELADHPALGSRIVLVKTDGGTVYADLEDHHLVAAIVRHDYFNWQHRRDREVGRGVIGRKDLASAIPAKLAGNYKTEHYEMLASAHYPDLPRLLAGYLAAHAAAERGPSAS